MSIPFWPVENRTVHAITCYGVALIPMWQRLPDDRWVVCAWTRVSEADLPLVQSRYWSGSHRPKCGAMMMHWLVMGRGPGDSRQDSMCVDHINGDPLDNRRENLRVVTYNENSVNVDWRRYWGDRDMWAGSNNALARLARWRTRALSRFNAEARSLGIGAASRLEFCRFRRLAGTPLPFRERAQPTRDSEVRA